MRAELMRAAQLAHGPEVEATVLLIERTAEHALRNVRCYAKLRAGLAALLAPAGYVLQACPDPPLSARLGACSARRWPMRSPALADARPGCA
jgi:hypothetical protein